VTLKGGTCVVVPATTVTVFGPGLTHPLGRLAKLTVALPAGTLPRVYAPDPLVVVERLAADTVTPPRGPRCGDVTVPDALPVRGEQAIEKSTTLGPRAETTIGCGTEGVATHPFGNPVTTTVAVPTGTPLTEYAPEAP